MLINTLNGKSLISYTQSADNMSLNSLKDSKYWAAGEELKLEDVEVAPPRAHEVRIRILWTGKSALRVPLSLEARRIQTPIASRHLPH